MARKPRVLRTLNVTEVQILCLNTVTGESDIRTFDIPHCPLNGFKDYEKILKKATAVNTDNDVKPVHIKSIGTPSSVIYTMLEEDFIKFGHKLTNTDNTKKEN